jgi:hypothetical protein
LLTKVAKSSRQNFRKDNGTDISHFYPAGCTYKSAFLATKQKMYHYAARNIMNKLTTNTLFSVCKGFLCP